MKDQADQITRKISLARNQQLLTNLSARYLRVLAPNYNLIRLMKWVLYMRVMKEKRTADMLLFNLWSFSSPVSLQQTFPTFFYCLVQIILSHTIQWKLPKAFRIWPTPVMKGGRKTKYLLVKYIHSRIQHPVDQMKSKRQRLPHHSQDTETGSYEMPPNPLKVLVS